MSIRPNRKLYPTRRSRRQFAGLRPDNSELSQYAIICGKLSRFLARNIATKKLKMRNAKPLVSFTFDDATASACVTGALLLERHQVRGTYYICGGGCDAVSPCGRLATTEQVKAIYSKGHEIGCHTYSHAAVASIRHDALVGELERNRSSLQSIHRDMIIRNFAYPYGELSFRTKRYLEVHFDTCRSITSGVNVGTTDLGALRTCMLQSNEVDFQGVVEIVAETVRRNGWLVFTSHDVADDPSRFGVTPNLLAFALKAARDAGCDVVTVRDALRAVNGAVDAASPALASRSSL
jgi:peptidoglycan/xylan/chitin deacetylase (PgdA/CDA1 family)